MAPRLGLLAVLLLASPGPVAADPPRTDIHGDRLPPGALLRLGTVRLRHTGIAQAVVFTPDGKTVISGGIPDVIRLWDAATGAPRGVFANPSGGIFSLALSPDGKTLAAGNGDGSITLWDLAGRRVLHTLKGPTGLVFRMFFTPDGKALLSGDGDGHVIIWDVATGRTTARFQADGTWVPGAALSADGKRLLTPGRDGSIRVWDVAARKEVRGFQSPVAERVGSLALSPDGKTVAQSGPKGVRLWDMETGRELRCLGRPYSGDRVLTFSPDGKTLFGDDECAIVCLDVATGAERRLEGHCESINHLVFSPDGKTLASASHDHTVRLWDAATGKEQLAHGQPAGAAVAAYLTPDGKRVVTAHGDQRIRVWDADTGRVVRRFGRDDFRTTGSRLRTAALSPDGKTAATAATAHDGDCALVLWDVNEGKELCRFLGPGHSALSLAFTPDGRTLASGGRGRQVYLWDVETGEAVRTIEGGAGAVFNVSLSGDGALLSLADHDHVHRLYAVADGRLRLTLAVESSSGPSTLSPDGRFLAAVVSGKVRLFEAASGQPFLDAGRQASLNPAARAFSPDGRLLAWGDQGNVVHVTDARSGEERGRFEGHAGPVTCVSFSADGKRLVSAGDEGTVLLRDTARLKPARDLPRELTARELDSLWDHLVGEDVGKARSAVESLVAATTASVPFLREHVRPVLPADGARVARLIRDLDSDDFGTREKATSELGKIGAVVESALREALKTLPSPEARRRLQQVLESIPGWQYPLAAGEPLRTIRAVEVLERTGAREELAALARGAAGARLTQEAAAALARLEKRPGGR